MDSANPIHPWYAVQVRARHEKLVASALAWKGYESFLPMYRARRRWSDRVKELELPLFDGYLFCRLDANQRLPLLITPGVIRIAGIGKAPLPVEESEVAAVMSIVLAGAQAEPHPYLEIGQRVRIDRGTMSGVEGILLAQKKPARLVVSVTLLQRSVSVEIDEACVRPAEWVSRIPCIIPPNKVRPGCIPA